jgi:hypothetical protein
MKSAMGAFRPSRFLQFILLSGLACLCVLANEADEPYRQEQAGDSPAKQAAVVPKQQTPLASGGSERPSSKDSDSNAGGDWKERVRNVFRRTDTPSLQATDEHDGETSSSQKASPLSGSSKPGGVSPVVRSNKSKPTENENDSPAETGAGAAPKRQVTGAKGQGMTGEEEGAMADQKDAAEGTRSDSPKATTGSSSSLSPAERLGPAGKKNQAKPSVDGDAVDKSASNSESAAEKPEDPTNALKTQGAAAKKTKGGADNDAMKERGITGGDKQEKAPVQYSLKLRKGPACLNAPLQVK